MHHLEERRSNAVVGIAIALAVFVFIGAIMGVVFATGAGDIFAILCPAGVFLLFLLGIMWAAFSRYMRNRYATPPEILISAPAVRIGETVTMSYHQTFKRDVDIEKLALRLIMRERATYQQGTDTVTVTHDHPIDEFGYAQHHFVAGQILNDNWEFHIPLNGMHTFKANHNEILWLLQVHLDVANTRFDFKRDYTIQILPQIKAEQ